MSGINRRSRGKEGGGRRWKEKHVISLHPRTLDKWSRVTSITGVLWTQHRSSIAPPQHTLAFRLLRLVCNSFIHAFERLSTRLDCRRLCVRLGCGSQHMSHSVAALLCSYSLEGSVLSAQCSVLSLLVSDSCSCSTYRLISLLRAPMVDGIDPDH